MAKLKQTLSDSAVHVELAIRYWANKPEDFHQFSTLVLKTCTTYEEAWVFERLLISKWQAPLNFPYITESKTDLQSGGFRSGGFCHVSIILISLKRKMKENERK